MTAQVIDLLSARDLFGARAKKKKKNAGPRMPYWRSLEKMPERVWVYIGGMEYGSTGVRIGEKYFDTDGSELQEVCGWRPLTEREKCVLKLPQIETIGGRKE